MSHALHDTDALLWSEQQSALLRRLAAGERTNQAVDWPNVIAEIEDVGLSELRSVESLLRQALLHLLKISAAPDGAVAHWRAETIAFVGEARDRWAASMLVRIDLAKQYRRAQDQVSAVYPAAAPPERCPLRLDALLDETLDVAALEARFAPRACGC